MIPRTKHIRPASPAAHTTSKSPKLTMKGTLIRGRVHVMLDAALFYISYDRKGMLPKRVILKSVLSYSEITVQYFNV